MNLTRKLTQCHHDQRTFRGKEIDDVGLCVFRHHNEILSPSGTNQQTNFKAKQLLVQKTLLPLT